MAHPFEQELISSLEEMGVELPRLEARWMREKLEPLTDANVQKGKEFLERRRQGEPLAYILEEKGFYKDVFFVKPGVLIPRPETELLVEKSLEALKRKGRIAPLIYDFGCGSGCIGLSLLRDLPSARLIGVDQSPTAIEVSAQNARNLKLEGRAEFQQLSISGDSMNSFGLAELIVANPPYIADDDPDVQKEVDEFEPHQALYSGPTGLELIRTWSERAFHLLKSGGIFMMEFGKGQAPEVQKILQEFGFTQITVYKDLAGCDRAVQAEREN